MILIIDDFVLLVTRVYISMWTGNIND